ncbi:winged helix-turn-helix transcriptional regulator [Gemella sp. GH3]|uniref:winged helix-turn-helix transcriptional regulator n=1 Tax=unclassified Gemella TaxID=2624949 RepID=UPI0015CFE9DB|nr:MULTISPECIES: winged helix-turn-helix transcriptional regulator [unclassified Gemella]MBF0714515.1 winged helix-turn-helix transcriptional regulator [Gemella sp. GH3.1]NYS51467.1 winged helix-turn-helix transcriptional regulator [Gemella sp. GH3]
MSKKLLVLEFLRENPRATNSEIVKFLNSNKDAVKSCISKLKKAKLIQVIRGVDGERVIKVLVDNPHSKYQEKVKINEEQRELNRQRLERLADKILETTLSETNTDKIIASGNLFIRIYDRL